MEVIHRVAQSLKLGRLVGPAGVEIVAIGLAATVLSLFVFTLENIWFFLTSNPGVFTVRELEYLPLAALSALFCLLSFFVCQSGFPRIAFALFFASMASHVFQWFVTIPAQQLKVIAICRICASLGLVLLYLRYRSEVAQP